MQEETALNVDNKGIFLTIVQINNNKISLNNRNRKKVLCHVIIVEKHVMLQQTIVQAKKIGKNQTIILKVTGTLIITMVEGIQKGMISVITVIQIKAVVIMTFDWKNN